MAADFEQIVWNAQLAAGCQRLIDLAIAEDLGPERLDVTTSTLVDHLVIGQAEVVARSPGVVCGIEAAALTLRSVDSTAHLSAHCRDGDQARAGQLLATLRGPAASLLSAERIILNFIGRLSGIATLTASYVAAIQQTKASIYDTRKTTPGWRRLEKYAVHCGGGRNHRSSLAAAVLIKDNHLALGAQHENTARFTPSQAVEVARSRALVGKPGADGAQMPIEIEVDTLEQLREVLIARPDIVLLDNMSLAELRAAVNLRDAAAPQVVLEASGGVNLNTVEEIAATGVDRISVGGLTHSAVWLDVALDWRDRSESS